MPMTASALAIDEPFMHLCLTGPSGSGKTSWAATAPRPWILVAERNAVASIIRANPDALITVVTSWKHFDRCLTAVIGGEPITYPDGQRGLRVQMKEAGQMVTFDFQTLVIDSMTAMSDFLFLHMQGGGQEVNRIGNPDSDAYDLTLQQRGRIAETLESVFREQRTFLCNTIFQFLPDVRDENDEMRAVYPSVSGKKVGPKIVAFFNGGAWIERQTQADGTNSHVLTFNRKGNYPTKLPPGFPTGKFVIPPGRGGFGLGAFCKASNPATSTPVAPWDNVEEIAELLADATVKAKEKNEDATPAAKPATKSEPSERGTRARRRQTADE